MSTESIAGVCELERTSPQTEENWSDSDNTETVAQVDPASLAEYVNVSDRINAFGLSFWKEAFLELRASRQVFWRLARREIVSRYRQSMLGLGWAILTPLAMAGVFIYLNSADLAPYEEMKRIGHLSDLTPEQVAPFVNDGEGTATMFRELVEHLAARESYRVCDIVEMHKAGVI